MQTIVKKPLAAASAHVKPIRKTSARPATVKPLRLKVLVLFGTRPEVIKLAPVISELKRRRKEFDVVTAASGQHTDLILPFVELFRIEINHDLRVMTENQTPNSVCAKIIAELDGVLEREKPDLILVQGDTTTALAGALTAFNRRIKVGHVEAGLRSGSADSPFPEEMNRRLISQFAAAHFAATEFNRQTLLGENINSTGIFVTGNPVVDALDQIARKAKPSTEIKILLKQISGKKIVLLTTHRREAHGAMMRENLIVLRDFAAAHQDVALVFPVHPNPAVRTAVSAVFGENERIYLLEPLAYADFVALMQAAWLIVSDSGGVQEEAPSLGKALLILRENTERPEAVASGTARIVGGKPETLRRMLEENYIDESWINSVKEIPNPFGDGLAAKRIAECLSHLKLKTAAAL